mgnify:CR=1 FL=1
MSPHLRQPMGPKRHARRFGPMTLESEIYIIIRLSRSGSRRDRPGTFHIPNAVLCPTRRGTACVSLLVLQVMHVKRWVLVGMRRFQPEHPQVASDLECCAYFLRLFVMYLMPDGTFPEVSCAPRRCPACMLCHTCARSVGYRTCNLSLQAQHFQADLASQRGSELDVPNRVTFHT